ncbi:MAG TPA: four helix bundle protein [Acidobacteriota bacterium]|nr:four helix bundle protein [Acidobacteriota bacterium]
MKKTSTFEDLVVWQKCRDLRKTMSSMVKTLPAGERTRLADQILRASRSVTANIAEGYGRFHYQENIQFCRQARGSLYELLDHLSVSADEGYIKLDEFEDVRNEIAEAVKLLNGYVAYLKKEKSDHQVASQPT